MENPAQSLHFQGTQEPLEVNSTPVKDTQRAWQQKVYRWHRYIGLLVLVPTIFWTASGIMHPFMSHWFKPKIAHEFYIPQPIQTEAVKMDLAVVLKKNGIAEIKNVRLVNFEAGSFFQVKLDKQVRYFSTVDGIELKNGDRKYALSMARFLIDDQKSAIKGITQIQDFDKQYKYVNRLLPVWKVSFDRADQMDVYVETAQSRMATFNNQQRKIFIWIFQTFHNWEFLSGITHKTLQLSIMICFLTLICLSALSGLLIYGLMWKRFRSIPKSNKKGLLRKYHRQLGLAVSLVTFTFALSGLYHATTKFTPDERLKFVHEPSFTTDTLAQAKLPNLQGVSNLSLASWDGKHYWRVVKSDWKTKQSSTEYLELLSHAPLKDGDQAYALFLVQQFSGCNSSEPSCCDMDSAPTTGFNLAEAKLLSSAVISKFAGEYGFVNKRLPVVKLAYDTPEKTTFYLETATGRLAAKVVNADRYEGLSFAFLHKYNGLDGFGKNIRDGVMTLAALGVLTISLFGLAVFLKMK